MPRRRLQRGAEVRRQQPSPGATAMQERTWQGATRHKSPSRASRGLCLLCQAPIPQRRGWGCSMTSKERGHVNQGKVVPGCGAEGLRHFQLSFDPGPRGGMSAGALRSIRCSGHGSALGGTDGFLSRGAAGEGCGWEGQRAAGTREKAPACPGPRGRQPFPAKGMAPQPPWKGEPKHKQAKPTCPSPSENPGLLPCSGQC